MSDIKLQRLEIRRRELTLQKDELEYIEHSAHIITKIFNFDNIQEINERTGHPYISLKILVSLYRRVRTLVNYEQKGKAFFTNRRRE